MKMSTTFIINVFVLLVSIVMIGYAAFQLYNGISVRYFSAIAEGEITGYYTKKADARFEKDRTPVFAPTFSFKDQNDIEYNVITQVFSETMKYKKGDVVTVHYNKNNPQKAYLNNSFPWKGKIILLFFGICGLIFTIPTLLKNFK